MAHEGVFIFSEYEANVGLGTATFHYRVERPEESRTFTEQLIFPPLAGTTDVPPEILTAIFDAIYILSGISYWKIWCPRKIRLPTISLTPSQADFWNTVYTRGLGELFYRQQINFWDLVQFPATHTQSPTINPWQRSNRSLLLVGGGKDSIVSSHLLKQAHKPFTTFALNPQPVQEAVMKQIGAKNLSVTRTLDPQLIELNSAPGTFNGHVPISAFYALTGILVAALHDYRYVIASNERSANYGNVEYLGATINHQWSKSFEFETLLRAYLNESITPAISFFSLLRPLSEIKIASLFAAQHEFFSFFSSCNVNFRINKPSTISLWCGECAKCAFVFVSLAAFLPKDQMIKMFGRNFLADAELLPTYRELLGLGEIKPFECVGSPEEVALAFALIDERGEYKGDISVEMFLREAAPHYQNIAELKKALLEPTAHQIIPSEFSDLIKNV